MLLLSKLPVFQAVNTWCPNFRTLTMKGSRAKRFVLSALLAEYYFLVLCSTVICRASHGERHIELVPFWNYLDIWNRVDYPADLIEVLLNMALFVPIGLLLGGFGFKTKKVLLSGICLSGIIEVSQFVFCKGLCETDDVMHNTFGCAIGYFGFLVLLKVKRLYLNKQNFKIQYTNGRKKDNLSLSGSHERDW